MFSQIIQKINEGGAAFIYPILFILVLIIVQFIKGIRHPQQRQSYYKLIKNAGWLAFAWGMFGKAFGLIIAFDSFKTIPLGELTAQQMAGGLRVVMLTPLVALFVFSVSRMFVLILNQIDLKK